MPTTNKHRMPRLERSHQPSERLFERRSTRPIISKQSRSSAQISAKDAPKKCGSPSTSSAGHPPLVLRSQSAHVSQIRQQRDTRHAKSLLRWPVTPRYQTRPPANGSRTERGCFRVPGRRMKLEDARISERGPLPRTIAPRYPAKTMLRA